MRYVKNVLVCLLLYEIWGQVDFSGAYVILKMVLIRSKTLIPVTMLFIAVVR